MATSTKNQKVLEPQKSKETKGFVVFSDPTGVVTPVYVKKASVVALGSPTILTITIQA